jgi:type I restriction enzyme S subunit
METDGEYPFFTCAREVYRINKHAFDTAALLISGNGANVGYVHYYEGKFNAYQRTYVLSDFSCDAHFLRFFLDRNLQARIRVEVNAGNTPYITMGTLTEMAVALPGESREQRAIATALSDVDELLAALDRLIAKKRDLKQAAMQQLLTGKTRLPGFEGAWQVLTFVGVFRKISSKEYQIQTFEYQTTGGFPVVDQGQEAQVGFSDRADKLFHCPKGGVVIFGDHTCIVKYVDFNFVVGADGTQILLAKPGHCTRFHALQLQFRGIATTGYNRHFKFLKERSFAAPPFPEQIAIAEFLGSMDAELSALEQRRDKTRLLKQAMMQELLTGRTRLVKPSEAHA